MAGFTQRTLLLVLMALASRQNLHRHEAQLLKIQHDFQHRRKRRHRAAIAHMQMLLAMTAATAYDSSLKGSRKRRKIVRGVGGWRGSCLAGYMSFTATMRRT
eukprot:6198079-Pleurochrysis_carterae.AAC.1